MSLCDKRLSAIKVPDLISRTPKSLKEIHRWKGICTCAYSLYTVSGVGRCFIAGGLTIVGVSINFNAGGSGGILPQEISNF